MLLIVVKCLHNSRTAYFMHTHAHKCEMFGIYWVD